MQDLPKLVSELGLPVAIAIVSIAGSVLLIRHLLNQQKEMGQRVGSLEKEYRQDLRGLIERNTNAFERVEMTLKGCHKRGSNDGT